MARLLIIDDDPKICKFLVKLADSIGQAASELLFKNNNMVTMSFMFRVT